MSAETDMEVVVVRPPLVYGPNAPGNFDSRRSSGRAIAICAVSENRQSIALDNLVDLLVRVIHDPDAANQTFLAADEEDVSTATLVAAWVLLWAGGLVCCRCPPLCCAVVSLLGKGDVAKILCGSLQIDIAKTRELLNWTPPVCVDEALRRALSWGDS